jgi:hypothetical protein
MAERNGPVHLDSMSNRHFESIKPMQNAKLAAGTKEVVTDGNPTYFCLIPEEKHARGDHGISSSTLNMRHRDDHSLQ